MLTDHRGQIIICNTLHGLEEGLFSERFVQDLFDWWQALYEYQSSSSFSALLATLETLVFDKLPKDFRPSESRPVFRLICNRKPRIPKTEVALTTVVPAFVFKLIAHKDDLHRLLNEGVEFPADEHQPWRMEALDAMMDLPEKHCHIRLNVGATIGRKPRLVWFTLKSRFDAAMSLGGKLSNQARDVLGLIHRTPGDVLIALHFSREALKRINSGRPVVTDAGTHCRFKARADSKTNRARCAWGHTVDLERFAKSPCYVDGIPERVAEAIDEKALINSPKINFTPLGAVSSLRGVDGNDNDECFARHLRAERDVSQLRHEILSIL